MAIFAGVWWRRQWDQIHISSWKVKTFQCSVRDLLDFRESEAFHSVFCCSLHLGIIIVSEVLFLCGSPLSYM